MLLREIDKILRRNMGVVFFAIAVLIRVITLGVEEHAVNAFTANHREAYLSIVTPFSGKITDQVAINIERVYQAVAGAQVDLDDLRQDYLNGEISREAYLERSRHLEVLYANDDLFLTFYSQFIYAQDSPEERYLLYEDGWNALLTQERFDWGFVLLTILFSASIYGREYESNMRNLLIATQKGDERLVITKFLAVFIIISLCSLISSTIEYSYFDLKYGLPHGDYPLQSLRYFQDTAFHLTLRQTFRYISAYRMLGYLLLSVITMFISVLSEKAIVTLATSLMIVVLPYALPIKASTKYLLPSPLGFLLAQGFFRSTQMGETYQAEEILFKAISQTNQTLWILGWLLIAMILLSFILIKFSPATFSGKKLSKRTKMIPLIFLVCCLLLSSCHFPTTAHHEQTNTAFNLLDNWDFTIVDGKFVTLHPYFLMEDIKTRIIDEVIRDPFVDPETIKARVSSLYSKEGKLYYLMMTDKSLSIIELDLSTYQSQTVYYEERLIAPSLLNPSESINSGYDMAASASSAFFLTDNYIYLVSNSNVEKIDRVTHSKETIIKDLRDKHLSFDGENIYYTNKIFELFVYNLTTDRKESLGDIRAEYFYLYDNQIFYSNVDEDYQIYMFDLSTNQSQLIVGERSFTFANDDKHLYFINQDDQQFLYRINLQTGLSEILVPISSLDLHLMDDYPFIYLHTFDYHTGRSEIYQVNKDNLVYQPIETLNAYMIDSLH